MKPRLLIIIPDLGPGGAQPMNLRLARHLQARDYPVRLVTLFKRSWHEPLDASGLDLVCLDAQGLNKPLVGFHLAPFARRVDLVIAGIEDAATNYAWLAAKTARKPLIAWTHIAFHEHLKRLSPLDRQISLQVRQRTRWMVFPSQGALDSMRRALGKPAQGACWRVIENFQDPLPQPTPRPPI